MALMQWNTSMSSLPDSEDSLLVRTDFSDDEAWRRVLSLVETKNSDGFRAHVHVVDDAGWDGAEWQAIREAALATTDHAAVLFIMDHDAMANDHPIQVVDLRQEAQPPFRCVAQELWSVDNNLNLANMDWAEFAGTADDDGVFRGFA